MKPLNAICAVFVLALLLASSSAQAQANRTWVSGVGDDANPCSRTAPCKTFAGAISKTAPNGEISVLDPGGYGAVTITKGITINGDGTLAGILNAATNGIIVNAGVNDNIILRNISIAAPNNALNGIRFLAGKSLSLDGVTISGFTGRGVDMTMTAAAKLFVRNTRITNGATGIFISTTVGQAQAMLDNVELVGLTDGFIGGLNGRATITRSVISGNSGNGILANDATSRLNVEDCQLSFNNGTAVNAAVVGGIIRLANNQIYNNNIGISAVGTVETAQDNRNAGNVTAGAPSAVIIPKQ